MMIVAVLDVDGVVADVRHRLGFLESRPRDWAAFFAAAGDDPPLPQGVELAVELAANASLVWLTGRPERLRDVTASWLLARSLPVHDLLMRPDNDRRPARLVKRDQVRMLRRRAEISVVVDDDPEVVEMVRAEGLAARLADWLGEREPLVEAQEDPAGADGGT